MRRHDPGAVTAVLAIARLTALEAMRGRLLWLVAGFAFVGCVIAVFAGEVAITESQGFRSGLFGAWLRLCAVFTVSACVVSSLVRDTHDKGLDLMLSMPLSRASYLIGKLVGFVPVSILTAGVCGMAVMLFAQLPQAALWATSLSLELLIVTTMSLLCAFTFTHVTWALGTVIGFYVISRSMASIRIMARETLADSQSAAQQLVGALVDALAFVLPDLDRFTESEWLIHDAGTIFDLGFVTAQTVIYVSLLFTAASFDLYRKAL